MNKGGSYTKASKDAEPKLQSRTKTQDEITDARIKNKPVIKSAEAEVKVRKGKK